MAVFGFSLTCKVIGTDDGLLRTSSGWAGPSFSSKLYVASLKLTVAATDIKHL